MAQTKSDVNARTSNSSDAIKSDIRHTRSEMDETLDELGQRLNPRRMLNDLIDMMSPKGEGAVMDQVGSTLKSGGKSVSRYAREHPVPALLMAAGVAWAIYDAAKEDEDERTYVRDRRGPRRSAFGSSDGSPYVTASAQSLDEEYSEFWEEDELGSEMQDESSKAGMMQRAKEAASTTGESIASTASTVGRGVSSAASSASGAASAAWRGGRQASRRGYRQAGHMKEVAGDYASRTARTAQEGMQVARERFDQASDTYPLAVAGGFIAAGLLAGLILPRTRMEDEWMGEAADDMWDQAKTTGAELVEQGTAAVADTTSAIMDEAEAQGLTPNEISEKVSRVAEKVTQAGKEAAKDEGLDAASLKDKTKKVGSEATTAAKSAAKDATNEAKQGTATQSTKGSTNT